MELTALQDPLWETPLLTAAHLGNLKLVRILLEAGAQRQGISVKIEAGSGKQRGFPGRGSKKTTATIHWTYSRMVFSTFFVANKNIKKEAKTLGKLTGMGTWGLESFARNENVGSCRLSTVGKEKCWLMGLDFFKLMVLRMCVCNIRRLQYIKVWV